MKRNITLLLLVLSVSLIRAAAAGTPYKLPPKEVVELVDAKAAPQALLSPRGDALLLVAVETYPPIELLAQPFRGLAGIRITTALAARQRSVRFAGIEIQRLDGQEPTVVALPKDARIGFPGWSHDGKRFAFTRDLADGVELWIGDVATGSAKALPGLRINDVTVGESRSILGRLGPAFAWAQDNDKLLVRTVPKARAAPPRRPAAAMGPLIDETLGERLRLPSFQDLLEDEHDQDLFEFYGRTQLVLVDAASGVQRPLGEPGVFSSARLSPDGRYVLVTRLRRPYSYRVPYQSSYWTIETWVPYECFARSIEVWDTHAGRVATIAELPVSDAIPREGVPTGARSMEWQPLHPATLVWTEALDGGDPLKKVPHRERLMRLSPPFTDQPREILKLKHRFAKLEWTGRQDQALLSEFDRDGRWTTTHLVHLVDRKADKLVFDRSARDYYKHPGNPVLEVRPNGEEVLLQDGDTVYLAGEGATPEGDRPFLDALDLTTLQKRRLFSSEDGKQERFVGFVRASRTQALIRSESRNDPPNFFTINLETGVRRRLTSYQDPAPQLRRVKRELIKYFRKDGVQLSGTLYLPADHEPGTRLPALVWAYPREYSDVNTAGQVRGSPHSFLNASGPSPPGDFSLIALYFVTQGYAVLMDATMPVVGDPETVNNSYVEQISENAKATVAKLDELGVADPQRVVVAGHSYGAFMTANLLAHTDLFVAGIARSGAYNRTLTPFGFATERRSFWEAGDLYMKMSPFSHAHRINEPILLIHGAADNNSGTSPMQSERLFEAIRGNGGSARLVMLRHESHNYRARESVLHTLAEMIDWANRWSKGRR